MLTRNNDIDRRIKAGKEYAELLPEGVTMDGKPRPAPPVASSAPPTRAPPPPPAATAPPPAAPPPKAAAPPPKAAVNVSAIQAQLAELEVARGKALAALEADYGTKCEQLRSQAAALSAVAAPASPAVPAEPASGDDGPAYGTNYAESPAAGAEEEEEAPVALVEKKWSSSLFFSEES